MREKIYLFLTRPWVIAVVILTSSILTYFAGAAGYFLGVAVALVVLWAGRFKGSDFGIGKPDWIRSILYAVLLAAAIFLIIDIMIQPLIEIYYEPIDLSQFEFLRGNLLNYLIFLVFMWVFAAIGEEFVYRGFFMRRLAIMLGNTHKAWLLSAILISALFGLAHLYQGISGVVATGLVGFLLSLIFYKNRNNLVLVMLTHGFYDVIGLTLIYFNKELIIIDWIKSMIT